MSFTVADLKVRDAAPVTERMSFHRAASSAVWIFGRYRTIERLFRSQHAMIVDDIHVSASTMDAEKPAPSQSRTMCGRQVQAAGTINAGGEIELPFPIR
jgi:3-keto-L-gulonate-6-phosphate decarboxylase